MSGAIDTPRAEPYIDWRAIFAGTVLAAGVSVTLLTFGSAIGLSVASTAPTWRDSSSWLWIVTGLFLVFVALCSFGFGGYAAGRMRLPTRAAAGSESTFRDGMHGLFTWGLAILVSALLALAGAAIGSRALASTVSPAGSVAGESAIASELDALFRSDRRAVDTDIAYRRAEAARILLKASGHSGVSPEDRDYLTAVIANRVGVSEDEAGARVDRAIQEAGDELHRLRVATVLQAFLIAAALMLGAAVAWFSAEEGGRDRERGAIPVWDWTFRRAHS